jgi:DNA adenine methylase
MKSSIHARPVLKWAGGKQALAERLITFFPDDFSRYYEPFIGGASVLLALRPRRAVIADLNDWLLDTYSAIRADHARVGKHLNGRVNTKEEYERLRQIQPGSLDLFERAAHLIYLNKTCFRGLFRVNRQGHFNVPYGAYERRLYDPENLEAVASCLRDVEIRHTSFEHTLADATPDDFIYMDPPYHKQGGYADFDRYTRWKFRESDHVRLAAFCRELDDRGVRWAVSNSDTSFVRSLYEGYTIHPIASRREINLDSQRRNIDELLIVNYA